MKLFKVLILLALAVSALSQDIEAPTIPIETEEPVGSGEVSETVAPTSEAPVTTLPPIEDVTTAGRRGKPTKLNCTAVECDQAVLTECEKPVLFLGDSCCPVCPMTDVCDMVECGQGEVCSEQDGEPICCTDKTSEQKNLAKRLRQRHGFERCSTRKEARTGVNRGACRTNSCEEDEVCSTVFSRAFCCPRPDADLPPCEGAAAVQVTILGRCHSPDSPRPTQAPGDCHCRYNRRHGKRHRPKPTEASPEEEEEEEEEEEPTEVADVEETEEPTAGRKKRFISLFGFQSRRRSYPARRSSYSRRRRFGFASRRRSYPRRPVRPIRRRCHCGYNIVRRFMQNLSKALRQIRTCRPAPRR